MSKALVVLLMGCRLFFETIYPIIILILYPSVFTFIVVLLVVGHQGGGYLSIKRMIKQDENVAESK